MPLNQKQKEAVSYLDGPLLVLAGPGTGKTQLLSEKVAFILKNTDTNPENILCLTFTETGASNMRERLKTLIGADSKKVNIGTYHAFGIEILGLYKNYSLDYARRFDSPIDEITQFKIIKTIQANLDGDDILRGDNIQDIISVISAAKSSNLTSSDLLVIAEQNISDSKVLSEAISPLLKSVVPRNFKESFEKAYTPIYDILKDYTNTNIILKNIEHSIATLARDLEEAYLEAEESQKIKPLSAWKDKYFEKDNLENYRLKDRIANLKLISLANVMKKYDDYLFENGLYDYDDMIIEAKNVLSSDAGFKATLSERYQFIMLDEFQDTNPAQFSIIKELTDYEKPNIMAVGDDDQAIYEFQGALASNLTDFKNHYNAQVIQLTENYRSTQEILDFSRQVINQAPDRFADKDLRAHKPNPSGTQIYRYEFLSSDQEFSFVANEISKLIKAKVPQSEIAVISYKTKYFLPLLPYLKAYPDIKIAFDKKDNLLENQKIHELIIVARFLLELSGNQKTTVNLIELFSFPFFNLPLPEIIKAAGQARINKQPLFDLLMSSETPEIKMVCQFFVNLVPKVFNEPLEVIINYLIGSTLLNDYKSPFLEYYAQDDYDTFSLYENIASLLGKVKKHYGDKPIKLKDFIEMIDDYLDANMPLNCFSPYKEADDAVSILTAHKAKGLEFKYVFIISADHTAWGKGKGNNNLLTLPKNLTEIRHTGMTDSERLRVLYVSLTRAKDSLYITNSLHDFNDKSPERLEYLNEYEENDEVISPLIPAKKVIQLKDFAVKNTIINDLSNWITPYVKLNPDLRLIYKERIKNFRMSASALTSFFDIVYAGPQSFFKTYILRAPNLPETFQLAYGDLVHATFEAVTNQNLSDEDALKYYFDQIKQKSLSPDIEKRLKDRGAKDLTKSLSVFGKTLRSGKAEVDLAPEKIVLNGVPVTGKVDHIMIDEKNKKIEIYDYKTGSFRKEKWQSHATLLKYMMQLIFYKKLLNNSSYSKYKIEKAHILFVTPDNDGEVYDKEYIYNEKDEELFDKLLKSVYDSVSTLSFIDDTDIFVPSNASLGLKDIKKFIELMLAKY